MPELPNVEVFRRYLNSTALHKTIEDVEVVETAILVDISPDAFRSGMRSRTMEETRRHGKYCMVHLDSGEWLIMHFGMTGFLRYYKHEHKQPGHARMLFRLRNGYTLAYDSQRKLGSLTLVKDVESFIKNAGLGPDALDVDEQGFINALTSSDSMMKTALMRQENVAGIGNIYADEILFQAGVHPKTRVRDLDDHVLGSVYRHMRKVLTTAIDRQDDLANMPEYFFLPERHEQGRCPQCGGPVKKIKVSGRTGWYCPACQKENS